MGGARSKLWSVPVEWLRTAVAGSETMADLIRKLEYVAESKNYEMIRKRLRKESIDFSHFPTGLDCRRGKPSANRYTAKPLSSVLVFGSDYDKKTLKRRLIREGLLQPMCYGENCTVGAQWLGDSIVLQLDHINGDRRDDRLPNLRLLCPNCHSQTHTWGRKCRTSTGLVS